MLKPITQPNLYGFCGSAGACFVEAVRCESIYKNGWTVFCYRDGAMLGCGPSCVTKKEAIDFAEQFLKDAVVECEFLNPDYSQGPMERDRMCAMKVQHLSVKERVELLRDMGLHQTADRFMKDSL